MVLQHHDKDIAIWNMNFNKVNFWVQVHDIPIRFMNRAMAEQICSSLGAIVGQLETFEDVGVVFY